MCYHALLTRRCQAFLYSCDQSLEAGSINIAAGYKGCDDPSANVDSAAKHRGQPDDSTGFSYELEVIDGQNTRARSRLGHNDCR